ncbi:collagen alpha-1(III) chain-like [Canis lupus dingo]|uniref:collagen alpha-1(III) chain-like n=1 Tax=Canis lupus dingo TaxID=286419 RepID=UPI0020C213BE|nr:collagen alpha-1(III) chain-like [Canis lupus dingo]
MLLDGPGEGRLRGEPRGGGRLPSSSGGGRKGTGDGQEPCPSGGSGAVGAQGPGTQGWELKVTPDLECGWLLQRIKEGGGKLQGERVGGSGCGAAPEARREPGVAVCRTEAARRWGAGPREEDRSRGQGGCRDCSSLPGGPVPRWGCTRPRGCRCRVPASPQPAVAAGRPGQQDAPKCDVRSSCLLKRGWFPFCPRPSPAPPGEATLTRERPPSGDWQRRARRREGARE